MAKKIMQFRYYGDSEAEKKKNYPAGLQRADLKSGAAFINYYPIIQLGIQSLPGLHFYLNHANTSVEIGTTGIYELDLDGYTEIDNLAFSDDDLKTINDNPSAYLMVDIICNKQEGSK